MSNTNSEKINKSESVLKEALLEYEALLNAAKNKLVENNSKELNSLIEKFLKESENKKESDKTKTKESGKDKKIQESTMVQKPIGEIREEVPVVAPATVNMKEASLAEVEAAFDGAQPDDEFQVVRGGESPMGGDPSQVSGNGDNFDLTSIEGEIDEMMKEINKAEEMQNAQPVQQQQQAVEGQAQSANPVDRFKQIHEEMGKYLKEIDEMNANQQMMDEFHKKMCETFGEGYKATMDESRLAEMFNMFKQVQSGKAAEPVNSFQADASAKPAPPQGTVAEVAKAPEEETKIVDEVHGVSLANNKLVGAEVQPRLDYGKGYAEHRVRLALQKESLDKKMGALVKENLALTKKLNTANATLAEAKTSTKTLSENYAKVTTALEKYRGLLKEMAVLNTNISYANSLFLNEGMALTFKDKQEIIGKFKKVGSINESEKVYKQILKEYTESKKTITESLEDKVASTIVESSSKNVIEESMNSGDDHVNRLLKLSGLGEKKKVM